MEKFDSEEEEEQAEEEPDFSVVIDPRSSAKNAKVTVDISEKKTNNVDKERQTALSILTARARRQRVPERDPLAHLPLIRPATNTKMKEGSKLYA